MIGNRTRSPIALARHQAAATAQNVAATVVRSASDALVAAEAAAEANAMLGAQQERLDSVEQRVGDLEDIP